MMLNVFASDVYSVSRISLARDYTTNINSTIDRLTNYVGQPFMVEMFAEPILCGFLQHYHGLGWSARSTNNQRQILLSLWQDAADRGMIRPPNRRLIKKLPEEIDPPKAWTGQQVADLIDEATKQRGMVGTVEACDWWPSLFLAIYWTSCRISSMLAVRSDDYDGQGITVRRMKNHRPQWYPLPESCRAIIEATEPHTRKLLWQHPWHKRTIWTKARAIIEAAGLPAPKTGRQLFHRLRRTTITLLASEHPEIAQRIAGHKDFATTQRHYIDPTILHQQSAVDVLADPLDYREKNKTPMLRIFA